MRGNKQGFNSREYIKKSMMPKKARLKQTLDDFINDISKKIKEKDKNKNFNQYNIPNTTPETERIDNIYVSISDFDVEEKNYFHNNKVSGAIEKSDFYIHMQFGKGDELGIDSNTKRLSVILSLNDHEKIYTNKGKNLSENAVSEYLDKAIYIANKIVDETKYNADSVFTKLLYFKPGDCKEEIHSMIENIAKDKTTKGFENKNYNKNLCGCRCMNPNEEKEYTRNFEIIDVEPVNKVEKHYVSR